MGYQTQLKFWRAIQKYGWDNFEHIIVATDLTEQEASQLEQQLINQYDSCNNGYNTDLGRSTTNHSPETLEKMRQSMLGKVCSEQTKEKLHNAAYKDFVVCIEINQIYDSCAQAEKLTGIDKSSISKCCRGIMYKAGGLTWRHANETTAQYYKDITDNRTDKTKTSILYYYR